MSEIHDEDHPLSDITNDCTSNETENSCNGSSNSPFSQTSSSTTSSLAFLHHHHHQRSHFPSSRNFHRWTNHAPAVTLSITLILFTSIMGFFAFHALFTSTHHKSTRVRTGTHSSKISSGTQGLPPEKDLLRLSQLSRTHQATLSQTMEDETNEGGNRRIRQNLAADYLMDTQDSIQMDYPETSRRLANGEMLLRGTHCLIPDLAMRTFDRPSALTNESKCNASKDQMYGIGDSRDCCFQVITHAKKSVSPNQWQSLVCTPIDPQDQGYSKRLLEKYEFVRISCKVRKNGRVETRYEFRHSISLESERVREKIQHWIDHYSSSLPPPPSILIIGLEGISRRRFHQSFPQSRNILLNELGFTDLKGYHVVGAKTLDNLIPLLMGKWKRDLVKVCNHRWTSYWDQCPFIWKKFDESNYVTLYAEDIPDSFNYGNQLGFEIKPTDYYFRPFLLEKTRQDNNPFCFGNITTTATILAHVQNFMEKFKGFSTPFFAFSWLNLERLSYRTIDGILGKFLLKSKAKDLLENTLVIVLSDHGLQAGGMRQGLHGYLDHRLPLAFIKLTSTLSAHQSALNENSQELASPFDIHDTLVNILSLTTKKNYTVSTKGRLLLKTMTNRTCAGARIESHWCTCNVKIVENPTSSSPFMRFIGHEGLIAIIISKLNEMAGLQKESLALPSTQASRICPEIFFEKVTYIGIAGDNDESSLASEMDWILIGVQVFPKHAQFEIVLIKKEWNKWEVVLPAIRTDTNKGYIYCLNIFKKRNKSITK